MLAIIRAYIVIVRERVHERATVTSHFHFGTTTFSITAQHLDEGIELGCLLGTLKPNSAGRLRALAFYWFEELEGASCG